MDEIWPALRVFLLLAMANTAPLLTKHWLGLRWAAPLDGGLNFVDGRPLFGSSKTIRGIVAAIIATALAAFLMGLPATLGALVGDAAMLGDLLSSFVKRRLGLKPSSRATGIDQIPEALVPLLTLHAALGVSPLQVLAITVAFFVLEMPAVRLYHWAGLRDQPY